MMSCSSNAPTTHDPLTQGPNTPKVDLGERSKEFKEELDIGREMAARLVGTFERVKEYPQAQNYLSLIGTHVARFSGRAEIVYSFSILNVDEPNAYATPGGFVFVTKGLLKIVSSEDELAAVLSHEIAHITEKHVYNAVKPETTLGSSLARAVGGGKSVIGAGLSKTITAGMKMLLEDGYGSQVEKQADSVGSMYLVAAGYSPLALSSFLKKLAARETTHELSKTHPPFPDRLKALENFYKEQGFYQLKSKANTKILSKRFHENLSGIRKN